MGSQDFLTDSELVKGCLAKSEEAWNLFYQQYQGLIRAVVWRCMPFSSESDRQDAYQEVYRSLVRALKLFKPDRGQLRTLVATVARNSCIGLLRHKTTESRTGIEVPVDHHGSGNKDSVAVTSEGDSQERQLLKAQLKVAINRLKEPCPEYLRMRYYEELMDEEIAEMLGKKENTVTQRIDRCLEQLRAMVVEFETEGVGL